MLLWNKIQRPKTTVRPIHLRTSSGNLEKLWIGEKIITISRAKSRSWTRDNARFKISKKNGDRISALVPRVTNKSYWCVLKSTAEGCIWKENSERGITLGINPLSISFLCQTVEIKVPGMTFPINIFLPVAFVGILKITNMWSSRSETFSQYSLSGKIMHNDA